MTAIGLPERRQQKQLVDVIRRESGVFAVEAPTATGKSIGNLIGAALHVKEYGGRGVVATYTNLLREQYLETEIPAARTAFPDLRFYSVAGAGNYLCAQRIGDALSAKPPGWALEGLRSLQRKLLLDPEHTRLDSTVDERLRRFARADTDACGDDARCKVEKGSGCGFRNARRAALDAQVVITNHALLAINAQLEGLILGEFSVAVVDECHKLPDALRGQLTRYVTGRALADKASDLLGNYQVVLDLADAVDEVTTQDGKPYENWPDEFDATRMRGLVTHSSRVTATRVTDLDTELNEHLRLDEDGKFNPKCLACTETARSLTRVEQLERAIETVGDWLSCCAPSDEVRERVGTVELVGPDGKKRSRLAVAPVTLDKAAGALLKSVNTAVFTSATVGCVPDPVYSLTACGIRDDVDESIFLDHPLQHVGRMDVLIDQRPDFWDRLSGALGTYGGSALVLTGSHKLKHSVARGAETALRGEATVLVQPDADRATDRNAVFGQFRNDVSSVLIGTASYYEGINAPGDTLRHVVIASLPWIARGPVEQQMDTNLRAQGDSFREVHEAPRIEMTLQQIMGRLIRAQGDYGRVTIMADYGQRAWNELRIRNAAGRFGSIPVYTLT